MRNCRPSGVGRSARLHVPTNGVVRVRTTRRLSLNSCASVGPLSQLMQRIEAWTPEQGSPRGDTPARDVDALLRGARRIPPRGSDRRRFVRKRVDLMGLGVDQLTEQATIDTVLRAVAAGRGGCLFTPNLHHMQAYTSGTDGAVYERSEELAGARLIV